MRALFRQEMIRSTTVPLAGCRRRREDVFVQIAWLRAPPEIDRDVSEVDLTKIMFHNPSDRLKSVRSRRAVKIVWFQDPGAAHRHAGLIPFLTDAYHLWHLLRYVEDVRTYPCSPP